MCRNHFSPVSENLINMNIHYAQLSFCYNTRHFLPSLLSQPKIPLGINVLSVFFIVISCRYEYHWADGTNIKKPIKCSAPKYIDYLMTWVQDQLDDETLFPSKIGMIHFVVSTSLHLQRKVIVLMHMSYIKQ